VKNGSGISSPHELFDFVVRRRDSWIDRIYRMRKDGVV
jgi:hypothetical protein